MPIIEDNIIIVFLLPIIFMFHDFEEILFMESWYVRNRESLQRRVPRFFPFMDRNMRGKSTAEFAMAVAWVFLLVSGSTVYSYLSGYYIVWWTVFVAFSVHLFVHIAQSIAVRGYVPAVVTSVLCLPYCAWGFTVMHHAFTIQQTLIALLVGILVAVIYVAFAHKLSAKISKHF